MSEPPVPAVTSEEAATRVPRVLVVVGLAVFLGLRLWGLHFGPVPVAVHADERHYAGRAAKLTFEDLNPHYFENPPAMTYALLGVRLLHEAWSGTEAHATWLREGRLILAARWMSAVLGALTALVVAAAASRLLGGAAPGLIAAVVVGFSFLHGRDSHYGVNDVPMVFLVAVSLWCAARAWGDAGVKWLLVSAAAAGLAAATKYNGAVALVFAAAALALRPGRRAGLAALLATGSVLGLVAGLAFVAGNPYAVLAFDEFREGFLGQYSRWGDNYIWGQSRAPGGWLYLQASMATLGFAHLLAAGAGLIVVTRRDVRLLLFLLAFPAAYLVGMLSKALFFWRFALPLLPVLAVLAAATWWRLARAIAPRLSIVSSARRLPAALALVLGLASVEPAARLLRHDQLLGRDHTWIQARAWVDANIPRWTTLFLEGYPPAFPSQYRVFLPRRHLDGLQTIKEEGGVGGRARSVVQQGGLLLTDSFYEQGWKGDPMAAKWEAFYRRLRENFQLVQEFPPGPTGDPQPFVLDGLYSPLVDLWSVERPGHTIRVYRIPPDTWIQAMVRD